MLLDNTKGGAADKTVAGWLESYTASGDMDIVTGYFTIGALSWLNERVNGKIERFRIVWGGIAGNAAKFDLLNREVGIRTALRLRKLAEDAIKFLEQEKVEVKAVESDFCHAKLFLLNAKDDSRKFFVTGNSNLTEAGLGMGPTNHIELNAAVTGGVGEYTEFAAWFDGLWNNTQKLREAKQEFLDEITKVFKEYTPYEVYMKILSELLSEEVYLEKIEQRLGRTEIYSALFDFQKKAVVSLVRMLEKRNGAVLADAVGLGKTLTALAVIKYYRMQNREVILLTPKRLGHNWERYTWHDGTIPDNGNFDYEIIFHSELNEDGLRDRLEYLTNEMPRLFVIDESHCLQNDTSDRYRFLSERILRKNSDSKVLMLSAAPVHNSFWGLRNQLKLIGGVENIDALFRRAQEKLNEWAAAAERPPIGALMTTLRGIDGGNFLKLTDSLILARTRTMVANADISFPALETTENIFETPNCVEGAETFADIIDMLPARLSAYMPAAYAGLTNKQVVPDDSRRAFRVVKLTHTLLIKRLESSWVSFKTTLEKITADHKAVLKMLERSGEIECPDASELLQDEDSPEFDELSVCKKQKISMRDIRDVNKYEKDLQEDVGKLDNLLAELEKFSLAKDLKIKRLIKTAGKHIQSGGGKKALIFTAYGDTAEYLFSCLRVYFGSRANVECVTEDTKNIEDIVKRFSPVSDNARDSRPNNPVDILIATDVLSEGRNLQDCDCVINYDIHRNPVRVIQRFGRIDRVGGKNKTVRCVNFWPCESIDEYMNLHGRVEERMAAMTVAGSAVPDGIIDDIGKINRVGALEQEQIKKSLMILRNNIQDTEPENLGLSHLSLEVFRQDLTAESAERYKNLPQGIFSGFNAEPAGLIALLQHKKNNDKRIAFVNENGEEVLTSRQEILQFLYDNKGKQRCVPALVEKCDNAEIDKLSQALRTWLESRIGAEIKAVMDGLFAGGQAALSLSSKQQAYLEETLAPDNWNLICWEVVSGGGGVAE